MNDQDARQEMRRLTRRSFVTGAVAAASGLGGLVWLGTREPDQGTPWPLRKALELNDRLGERLFSETRLAKTYPLDRAEDLRVNKDIGLQSRIDLASYKLRITMDADSADVKELPLAAIFALEKVEMVTELRCVEGWSQIVHWGGVRFAEFAARYGAQSPFVGMATPDGAYTVSFDAASALHPQTLLCWELNGKPLTREHGAPIRLVSPVKYGWKSIKRIGTISFCQRRPSDYWVERGYDWYAGL